MKKFIFNLFLLLSSILFIVNTASAGSVTMADGPIPSCVDRVNSLAISYNFGNMYHGGFNTIKQDKFIRIIYKDICSFYVTGGHVDRIVVDRIFPVYLPKINKPIGIQAIYLGQNYLGSPDPAELYKTGAFFASQFKRIPPYSGIFPELFNGGALKLGQELVANNETYLASKQEPYISAPMIQMYSYHGRPLLVARSNSGVVTDVFIEDFKNHKNMKQVARRYLGDKWYHP